MAGKWKETSLADVIDVKHGFAFPGENFRDEPPGDILLTPGNFAVGGGFKGGKFKYFDGPVPDAYVLKEGDLIVTMTDLSKHADTLGYPAIVPQFRRHRFLHNQRLGKVLIKRNAELDKGFLFYLLRTAEYRHEVLASATGSTVKHTSPGRILAHKACLPPLPEQRVIASILGSLDDLIELNRETNELLEEMARALFKNWFVDFDPVRAKLEGRPPAGMNAATAALFPEHFQDSELGQIPRGWGVGKVGDVVTLGRVAVNPGNFPSEVFYHYSLPAFDDGRSPKMESGSTIMSNKFVVEPDAVLLSKLNPHIPRVWLPDLNAALRSVCSTEFMVARAAAGSSREYLFNLFTNSSFASVYGTMVSGTTGSHQRIGPDSFMAMQVVAPPGPLIKAFTNLVRPMFDTIHSNLRESRDLATLRDTLLPKLLSGEITVPVAEELVTAAS
jgi:type I restriction enzyme S subunit